MSAQEKSKVINYIISLYGMNNTEAEKEYKDYTDERKRYLLDCCHDVQRIAYWNGS